MSKLEQMEHEQKFDKDEFRNIMTGQQAIGDNNRINGTNWVDPYNKNDIIYELVYDWVYRSRISIKAYKKLRKAYRKNKDGTGPAPDTSTKIPSIPFTVKTTPAEPTTSTQKAYSIVAYCNDALIKDEDAVITILGTDGEVLVSDQVRGAKSINIKTPDRFISIVTIGTCTQYNRIDNVDCESLDAINLKPLEENNYSAQELTEIPELIKQSGVTSGQIYNKIDELKAGLRTRGNNEFISGSIQCWLGTRIHGSSASMVCDYANNDMVQYLETEMRKWLDAIIIKTKPLTAAELYNFAGSFNSDEAMHIVHGTQKIFITRDNLKGQKII